MKKPRETKRSSDEAVKEKTGKIWAEWFQILDQVGAKKWPHQEIAAYLLKEKVSPWWCQMVAVGYEHARGIRQKFQKCDGEFSTSGSRTLRTAPEGVCRLDQGKTAPAVATGSETGNHNSHPGEIRPRKMGRQLAIERWFLQQGAGEDADRCRSRKAGKLAGMRQDEILLVCRAEPSRRNLAAVGDFSPEPSGEDPGTRSPTGISSRWRRSRGTRAACATATGDAACAAPWLRSGGSARA